MVKHLMLLVVLLVSSLAFSQLPSAHLISSIRTGQQGVSTLSLQGFQGNIDFLVAIADGSQQVASVVSYPEGLPIGTKIVGLSNGSATRLELWNINFPSTDGVTFTFSSTVKFVVAYYQLENVNGHVNLEAVTGSGNPQIVTTNVANTGDPVLVGFARQGSASQQLGSTDGCVIDQNQGSTVTSGSLHNVMAAYGASNNQPTGPFSCSISETAVKGIKLSDPWAAFAVELTQ